ncbi:hypothetical protein [Streptomyces sp. CA-111067]|uniref:hypothetical protein n=1 Tax=Streptomyces sp. CA-111067 TaxID=3240046 RepID=UPI003D9992E0
MSRFVPAEFDLYEFDDRDATASRGTAQRRRFGSWNGLIGAPAADVSLDWSAGDSKVIVCTSGQSYDRAQARYRAGHVALGGDALPIPGRPQGPGATFQALDEFASSDDLWTVTGDAANPEAVAETAALDGFSIGHRRIEDGIVFIAAVNVEPARFEIRKVRDWSVYDVDAGTGFPLSALNG